MVDTNEGSLSRTRIGYLRWNRIRTVKEL